MKSVMVGCAVKDSSLILPRKGEEDTLRSGALQNQQ